jgi:hypothetical protein
VTGVTRLAMSFLSLQTKLCYKDDVPTHEWCFYEAVDNYSIIPEIILLLVVVLMAIWISKHCYRLFEYRKNQRSRELLGHVYIKIFIIVYLWVFCI